MVDDKNKSDKPDEVDEEEDEFAAFEREAKAAAAAAAAKMAEGKKAAETAQASASPAAVVEEDDEEEDEFAAFEREAREAAAAAQANMGGGASGSEAAASTSQASEAAAGEEAPAGDDDKQAAPVSDANAEAKAKALEKSEKAAKKQAKALFSDNVGVASQTILVVGGGIAGVTAATEAAETGYDVILLEKGPALGGRVTRLNRYFPKLCNPNCGLEINYQRIRKNPRIKVMTMCEVAGVSGDKGNYTVSVSKQPTYVNGMCDGCGKCADATDAKVPNDYNYGMDKISAAHLPHEHAYPMAYVVDPSIKGSDDEEKLVAACPKGLIDFGQETENFDLNVGAIIWATGWQPYDASKIEVYSYDYSPDIINNVEMERLANHDGPTGGEVKRPSNGEPAKKVALIQCAGSRDQNHLAYCSMICCLASLKHAAYVREQYPDSTVDIYYIDIRAHDKMSNFYERIRYDENVNFIKSKPGHIDIGEDGRPVLCGERTIDREIYREPYDLVVLATGMEASLANNAPEGVKQDEYGFVIDDGGQFAAGTAGGPFDVALSTQSATAAALKAIQAVRAGK